MAIKTFTSGEVLTASDTNTYLSNSGLIYHTGSSFAGLGVVSYNISGYKNWVIVMDNMRSAGGSTVSMQLGGINTGIYYFGGQYWTYAAAPAVGDYGGAAATAWAVGFLDGTANKSGATIWLTGVGAAQHKTIVTQEAASNAYRSIGGQMRDANVRTTVEIFVTGTTMEGTIRIYGVREP